MRARLETLGVPILFAALVLDLLAGIVLFPVWSVSPGGVEMRILLGYIGSGPVGFVLERLLPAAAVVGVLGVGLLEAGRRDVGPGRRSWLGRERIALLMSVTIEAAVLISFGLLVQSGTDVMTLLSAVGMFVTLGISLYLFWTAERLGSTAKTLRLGAVVCAIVSSGLSFSYAVAFESVTPEAWSSLIWLDIARWLFGEIALTLWIVVFSGIVRRSWTRIPPALAGS